MKISRKDFLKTGALSLLGASSLMHLQCITTQRNDSLRNMTDSALSELTDSHKKILWHASLAPSGHNSQPWTVHLAGRDRWIIGTDRTRWLPAVDPENRETMLSLGAFMENLRISAGLFGLRVKEKIISSNPESDKIIEVKLSGDSPSGTQEKILSDLKKRRTLRKNHKLSAISSEHLTSLFHEVEDLAHYYPLQSKTGQFLSRETVNANRIQTGRDDAMEELSRWIRWNRFEIEKYRNGITPASMEISGISRWYVETFYSGKDVMTEEFRNRTVAMAEEQVARTGGWIVINSAGNDVKSLINCGGIFQKIFLRARKFGIALHPMTQILEEAQSGKKLSGFSGLKGNPQFILRAGYVESYPEPESPRMPFESFLRTV